jgi:alanine racemase
MDMVRVGMLGYGQSMTAEAAREMDLRPIMRWCAKVVAVLDLEPGESVSYGRIYRTAGREKIAVLSAGYADGYSRSYSNRVRVILGGREVPQCGKVCMDYTMANITGMENVRVGDEAVLLGCQDGLCITPDSLSAAAEYGVNGWTTAQVSARVPRIYLRRGEIVETRTLFH